MTQSQQGCVRKRDILDLDSHGEKLLGVVRQGECGNWEIGLVFWVQLSLSTQMSLSLSQPQPWDFCVRV